MLIAGSFRVVGAEWRTALGVGRGGEEDEQSQSSKPNQAEALEKRQPLTRVGRRDQKHRKNSF
jgi:hypothetical protein